MDRDDALRRRRAAQRRRSSRRRRLVAAGTLGALLALVGVLTAGGEDPPAGTAARESTLTAVSVARPIMRAAPIAEMPGAHLAPREPVPILMYHVIGRTTPGTPLKLLWVSPEEFTREVRALKRRGYNAVTLRQVWKAWHHGGKLPRKPIVFTFDDGSRGHVTHALAILRRAGWAGVLNLTLKNLRDMGGSRAVRRMIRAGWEVESHTLSHQDLTTLSAADLRREVAGSRTRLRRLFGVPVSFFCYPSGTYDDAVIAALRDAGYRAATTVQPGWASPDAPFTLPRVRVDGGMGAAALLQRISEQRPPG
ncbi:MAG: polysaccharide deacetylase family protein [Solirubrobacteraceae bacterium]